MTNPPAPRQAPRARHVLLILLALLALRVGAILLTEIDLYADEAQYWRWSRDLAWGYYSKPPMIAWVIRAATELFGNGEWAVRLAAPVLHTIAAGALYCTGRAMFDARVGFLAALLYAFMPGVILSATILSTDGVLLPFWCLALLLFWRLREAQAGWWGALGLGIMLGGGFLAKYAMVYFAIGMALSALFDANSRRALASPKGLAALAMAGAIFAPHLAWNALHGFETVSHTVDNANLEGELFHPGHLVTFLLDQMGVFGPISFLALIIGLVHTLRMRDGAARQPMVWLLAFTLPVLVIIAVQSVLSRAHANWAATAYPAASILVAAWMTRLSPSVRTWVLIAAISGLAMLTPADLSLWFRLAVGTGLVLAILGIGRAFAWQPVGLVWSSVGLHAIIAAAMLAIVSAPSGVATALGLDNGLKRVRAWEETAEQVARAGADSDASAILVDEREIWHGLDYYGRNTLPAPLIAWRRNPGIKSFSERAPLTDAIDNRVLVASVRPNLRPRIRADFEHFERIGEIEIRLGMRTNGCAILRRFVLYHASGHTPQPRTRRWEQRFNGLEEAPPPPCPE